MPSYESPSQYPQVPRIEGYENLQWLAPQKLQVFFLVLIRLKLFELAMTGLSSTIDMFPGKDPYQCRGYQDNQNRVIRITHMAGI